MKSTILKRAGFPRKRGPLAVILGLALASGATPSLCAEPLLIRIESGRAAESLDDQPAAVSPVERPAGQAAAPAADLGDLRAGYVPPGPGDDCARVSQLMTCSPPIRMIIFG